MHRTAYIICLFFLLSAARAADYDHWIESRGLHIPITLNIPDDVGAGGAPLVVLAHGHGGTRHENGGFTDLAALLAENGIASVRMDFAGCGDSTEAFSQNNLATMLEDLLSSYLFAFKRRDIDSDRIGLLGYSMGARVAMLTRGSHFDAIALWAPVGTDGPESIHRFVGGRDRYETLRETAYQNGAARIVTPWGQEQLLGHDWFVFMDASEPATDIRDFAGPVLILHGADDVTISPAVGKAVADAAASSSSVTFEIIPNAGHGLGFYSDNPEVRLHVLETTVEFFRKHLIEEN